MRVGAFKALICKRAQIRARRFDCAPSTPSLVPVTLPEEIKSRPRDSMTNATYHTLTTDDFSIFQNF